MEFGGRGEALRRAGGFEGGGEMFGLGGGDRAGSVSYTHLFSKKTTHLIVGVKLTTKYAKMWHRSGITLLMDAIN